VVAQAHRAERRVVVSKRDGSWQPGSALSGPACRRAGVVDDIPAGRGISTCAARVVRESE